MTYTTPLQPYALPPEVPLSQKPPVGRHPGLVDPGTLSAIEFERFRQIRMGYTAEHDDKHGTPGMILVACQMLDRVRSNRVDVPLARLRQKLIETVAILIAAIESIDRQIAAAEATEKFNPDGGGE